MNTRANWFETFFHGVANDLWRKCISPEQTGTEADFLEKLLGRRRRLLDVPCGSGRHSLELARRGHRVTGVDLSQEFIDEASAAARARRLKAQFIRGDMRRLDWHSQFDGAFCFGNSFGYLEYPAMGAFVRGVACALKPGGRFVIQTGMAAESILPTLKEREWYQVDDILFAIENHYEADVSCLQTTGTFVRNGTTEVRKWWHWVYTVGEIRRMLATAGLEVRELYGSLTSEPFKAGNPVLYVVSEKPPRGKSWSSQKSKS
jgi:SAM-dependent methyltransferase